MERDIEELKSEVRRQQATPQWQRAIVTPLGYVVSLYCLYRIVMSAVNVAFQRRRTVDPVSRWMAVVAAILSPLRDEQTQSDPIDIMFWSQSISFVFVGILIAASLRGFFRHLQVVTSHLSSKTSSDNHTWTSHISLSLSLVVGCYFITSIVLMRVNLPPQYRTPITATVGDIDFDFYHNWFDALFIIASLLTALSKGFIFITKRMILEDHFNLKSV
jgi:hypothetical protein